MPITIRDETFEKRVAQEVERQGHGTLSGTIVRLASERLAQLDQRRAAHEKPQANAQGEG